MGGGNPDNRPAVLLELSLLWCWVVSLADSTGEVKSVVECVLEQVFGDTEPLEKWLAVHINTTMGTITVQPQQVIVNNIHLPLPPPSCPLTNSFCQKYQGEGGEHGGGRMGGKEKDKLMPLQKSTVKGYYKS